MTGEAHFVDVIEYESGKTVKSLGPYSERQAEKADSGVNRQLNHADFYTIIRAARKETP